MSKATDLQLQKRPLSALIGAVASPQRLLPGTSVAIASLLATPALAVDTNITPDSNFTSMAVDGSGTHFTISSLNPAAKTVNVFDKFVVGTGDTVDLKVPQVNGTDAVLVNIVRDGRTEVWGTLNSVLENNKIGGTVIFASSGGFLVGSSGVVNVGNLTVRTPTSDEMNKLISGGAAVDSEVTRLINGEMSINESSTISIQGKLVTGSGLTLDGGKVEVGSGGIVMAGRGYQAVFQSAVNTGDYTAPTDLEVDGGTITIKASNGGSAASPGINIDGDLIADGGINIGLSTKADPDISFDVNETAYINLGANSLLDTRDNADGGALTNAGNITISATTEADVNFALAETDSKVSLGGEIQAGALTVNTRSDANAEARDAGTLATKTVASAFTGINFSYLESDASSIIEVGSGANINTQGHINLTADANAVARSNDFVLSSQAWALGTNYSRTDATAHVVIQSGATVKTQGDLNLRADNEAYIESAVKNYILDDDADYALAVAVGNANVDAWAQIDSGVILDADNLSVVATNQNYFQLKASISDYSEKGARGGFSVAIGDFHTDARAIMGASIGTSVDPVGNVQVASVNRTHRQQVAASVSVGASGAGQLASQLVRTGGSTIGQAAANKFQTDITDKSKANSNSDASDNSKTDDTEENKVNWKAGSAFALNLGDNNSYAYLGNTETNGTAPTLYSNGDVYVLTANDTYSWRTSAESSISAPKCEEGGSGGSGNNTSCSEKSYSFAINVAVENLDTRAEIGENTVITAANVAVDASQRLPITQSYTEWQNLESITSQIYSIIGTVDGKGGMVDNLLTNFANASASAEELSIGATVNSTIVSIDTSAWISDGASITATGTGAAGTSVTLDVNAKLEGVLSDGTSNPVIAQQYNWNSSVDDSRRPDFYETDGEKSTNTTSPFLNTENRHLPSDSVVVKATNIVEDLSILGNMGTLLLGPAGGTNKEGKSLGGAVSVGYKDVNTLAGVGDAKITANTTNNSLGVYSDYKERHIVITPTSGSGKGFGFNGILNVLITDGVNHASVSKDAEIKVDTLEVSARHDVNSWTAAGAVVSSTPTAIGMALTTNINTTDNKAYIGDNTGDRDKHSMPSGGSAPVPTPAPSSPAPVSTTAGINSRNIKVKSATSGMVGAVAAAGAYTSGAPRGESSGGYAQQAKSYLKDTKFVRALSAFMPALATGTSTSASGAASSGATGSSSNGGNSVASADVDANNNPTNTDSSSNENKNKVNTGWTGAGSFSLALTDIDSQAIIDGAIITNTRASSGSIDVQGLSKITGVSASGAAGLTWASGKDAAPDNTNNMAGAIAYQFSANDTRANIFSSTITNAGDVSVNAVHGGDRVSLGLGLSITVDASKNEGESRNAGISFSGAAVEDTVQATVEDSSITSVGWNDSLEVTAYNTTNIGVGGGAFYFGGTQGLGLAITVATIGNNTNSLAGQLNDSNEEEVLAGVYNSTLTDFQDIDISSRDLSRIAIAAAGGGYGSQGGDDTKDTKGFAGSFAISDIGVRSHAIFHNSNIATSNSSSGQTTNFDLNAIGSRNGTLDTVLSGLGNSGVSADYDFSGEKDVLSSNSVYSDDTGDGAAISANSEGARIIAVAGVLQAGSKQNVGLSYIHSDIHNSHQALVTGTSQIRATNVGIAARDEALIYNVAIGIGVSKGDLAGVGSVSVAEVNNRTHAQIGSWDGTSSSGSITATNLAVQANNETDIFNLAGAVAFAKGDDVSSKAGGLAATVTLLGNQQGYETYARVANTALDVSGNISVKALSGTSSDENKLISNSIGVGITGSGTGIAFAGAVTTSNVDQSVHAAVKNVGTSGSMNMTAGDTAGDLNIIARDDTFAVGTAWTVAGAAEGNALGISITTNRVDSDVSAEALGNGSSADSTNLKVSDATIQAERDNRLLSIDVGVAVGDKLSGAGSVGTNVIDGDVTARIADQARIDAFNNVSVKAHANTLSEAGSGAVGVGLNGGAGAVALATALEYGDTKAYVQNAVVNAAGRSGQVDAITGELKNDPSRPTFGEDGTSENEKKGSDVDVDAALDGFAIAKLEEKTEKVTGLLVEASSVTKQRAIDLAGSYGSSYAAAINVATNATWGQTQSFIDNSSINTGLSPSSYTGADVNLRAANHTLGLAISGGGAYGGTGGGVAGFATNHFSKEVKAELTNSTVNADDLNVIARQTNLSQAVAAGIGGGGSYGGAASVVITVMKGDTQANITGATVTAGDVAVNAESIEDSAMASGAAGIGGKAGVGATLAINILQNNTESYIGTAPDSRNRTTDTTINADTLAVDANRQIKVENWSFGVGAGGNVGAAVMLGITETGGHTLAGIYGMEDDSTSNTYTTKVRGQDGSSASTSLDVSAQETTSTFSGALGIGGGASLGVGAVANVILQKSQVIGEVVGSQIKTADLDVSANSARITDLYNLSFGGGKGALAASIGVIMTGKGDGGDANTEFSNSYQSMAEGATSGDSTYDNVLSDSEKAEILSKRTSDFTITDLPAAAPTDPANHSGYSKDGSTAKLATGHSATLAHISGGHVEATDLSVIANALHHDFSVIGAAQGSAVGVSAGLGFTRINEQVQATIDTDLDATNVSVKASMADKSDDDASAEMLTIVAGAGGTAIGVAVADVRSSNRVLANISQGTGTGSGTLDVLAQDTTQLRVGDIDASFNSDEANDRIDDIGTVNAQFGIAAVGVSYNHVEKESDVDAWLGADGGTISGFDTIYVDAISSGVIKAVAYGAAGGVFAGAQAVVAKAIDSSSAKAVVAGDIWTSGTWDATNSQAEGLVMVNAIVTPETIARSYGITVSGLGAVGGSFSYATADATAEVEVDSDTNFYFAANSSGAGPADLNAAPVFLNAINGDPTDDDYESALALSFAASGGLVLGLTGSHAEAENTGSTRVKIEDRVNLPYNDLSVSALGVYRQRAESDGYFAGSYAGGASIAGAYSNTTTEVLLGKDLMGSTRSGDISLSALAETSDMAFSIAGGGGVVAGSAAEAHAGGRDKSGGSDDDKYKDNLVRVAVDDWTSGQQSVDVASLAIQAQSNHKFFAGTDSTVVSVVGGSGASSFGHMSDKATIELGDNVKFHADRIAIQAAAMLNQYDPDRASSVPHFNDRYKASVQAGSGGILNGAASDSFIKAEDLDATVDIGSNAALLVNADDNTLYSTNIGNNLLINATSGFGIADSVTLVVGGAFQGAGAESEVTVNTKNTINVGSGATIQNDIGKLGLGAWSRGSADSDASASLYAAAGVAGVTSKSTINSDNIINVGDNAKLQSTGLLNVLAGRSGDYLNENALSARSLGNIYLGALIPIEGSKVARSTITANNTVNLGAADILSVRDIFIEADEGAINAENRGVVKNLYDTIGLSSEETFGNSSESGSAVITFTGNTDIEAGIYHEQIVEITSDGKVYVNGSTSALSFSGEEGQVPDSFSGKIFKPTDKYSAREEMQNYLTALNSERSALVAALMAGNGSNSVTNGEQGDNAGDTPANTDGSGASSTTTGSGGLTQAEAEATSEVLALDGEIAFVSSVLTSLPSTTNSQIIISDVIAAGGNVTLAADSYSAASTTPDIVANGDPLIKVTNLSNNTLVLGNLEIPVSSGGNIVLEGGLSVSDLATKFGTSNTTGAGGLVDIDHQPVGGTSKGDVAIQGLISNLGGTVDINAVTGSVIQTAAIEARELAITVNTGTYLLNNPSQYQAFGFDPKSLVNYTSQFKPQTADDFVDYNVSSSYHSIWTNGNWDTAIDDGNDNHPSFNEWFYGDVYDDDIDQDYLASNGRIYINVFKNWGFRDIEGGTDWYECSSNCVQFAMGAKKYGDERGGGDGWKFTPIDDKRNQLTSTASYSQVYNAGYGDRGGNAISAQTVAINAYQVDINGTIRAGNYNNWSVQVGSGFDAAMAGYVAANGLKDGDQVLLSPNGQLRYSAENPNYNSSLPTWFPGNSRYIDITVNPEVSLVNRAKGDAGISLVYDVGSQSLQMKDVTASGNGSVTVRGRIMSTGQNGRIQVDNGLGDIKVVNNSQTTLEVGNIDAGSTSAGVVRITDLNTDKKVNGKTVSQWYVHTPGGNIQTYTTLETATSYTGNTLSSGSITGSSATYTPTQGQVYWFKEEKQISRSVLFGKNIDDQGNGWVATYGGVGSGDTYGWVFDNQNTRWDLVGSGVTTCQAAGLSCDANGSANNYLTHTISADGGERRTSSMFWGASYSDYYGGDFTNNSYVIRVASQLGLDAMTYVKADHNIGINFIGSSVGKVDVQSAGDLVLTGAISNTDGITTLKSTNGSLTGDINALSTSDELVLYAKENLGTFDDAFRVQTDRLDAQSLTGIVNLDVSSNGATNIQVDRIWATGDLTVASQAGLLNNNSQSVVLKGQNVDITLASGGLGNVDINNTTGAVNLVNVMTMDSNGVVTISSGTNGDGEREAIQGNLALREVSGNLQVDQILANGDIYVDVAAGSLVNVNSRNTATAEEQAYEEDIWSILGLNDDTFAVGQAQVNAYNQAVTSDYHRYFQLQDQIANVTSKSNGSLASAEASAEASNDTANAQRYALMQERVDSDFAETLRQQTENGLHSGYNLGSTAAPNYSEWLRLLGDQQSTLASRLTGSAGEGVPQGVGINLAATYNKSFAFDLQAADNSLYTQLLEGARWQDSQLEVSINRKAFENTDSGSISNADRLATLAGVDVFVSTNTNLGTNDAQLALTITRDNPNLSGAEKAALLNASAGDVRAQLNQDALGNFLSLDLNIDQVNTVKIDATGYQNLQGGGLVYVESELDQKIHRVQAGSDARLETEGSILASGQYATAITTGGNLNLAANNGIGQLGSFLGINVGGALKDASSSGSIFLFHDGSMRVGNVNAGDQLYLDVNGDLLNWDQGLAAGVDGALINGHMGATDVHLRLAGNAGTSSRHLVLKGGVENLDLQSWDFGSNSVKTAGTATGYIDFRSDLSSLDGMGFAGSLFLDSDGTLNAKGNVHTTGTLNISAGSITSAAGSHWLADAGAQFTTTGAMALGQMTTNGSANLTAGGLLANSGLLTAQLGAALESTAGNIQLGENLLVSAGDLSLTALAGDINMASGKTAEASGALIANAQTISLNIDNLLKGASLDFTTGTAMQLGQLDISGAAKAVAGSQLVLLDDLNAASVNLDATTDLHTQGLNATSGIVLVSGNDLWVEGDLSAADLDYTAGGKAQFDGLITLSNNLLGQSTGDSLFTGDVSVTNTLEANSDAGINFASGLTAGSVLLNAANTIALNGAVESGGAITLSSTAGDVDLLGDTHSQTGNLTLTADLGNINLGNLTLDAGDLILSAVAGDVSLASSKTLDISGVFNANANSLSFAADSQVNADSLAAITTTDLTLGAATIIGLTKLDAVNLLVAGDLSAADLEYATSGSATFNGLVNLSNSLKGQSTADSAFAGDVTIGGSVDVAADAGISFAGGLAGDTLLLNALGTIAFNGLVESAGAMTLTSSAGDLDLLGGTHIQAGDLQLTADNGNINLGDVTLDAGNFALSAPVGSVSLGSANTVAVNGDFTGSAHHFVFDKNSLVQVNNLSLTATGDMALGQLDIANLIDLSAAGSLQILGTLKAKSLDLAVQNDLALGGLDIEGDLNASSGGSISIDGSISADNLFMSAGANFTSGAITSAGTARLSADRNLHIGDLSAGDSVSLTSGSALTTGSILAESLDFSAGTQATFGAVNLDGDLVGRSGGSSGFGGAVNLGGILYLSAGGDIVFATSLSGKTLTLDAGDTFEAASVKATSVDFSAGEDLVLGQLASTGAVTLNSGAAMTLGSLGDLVIGGATDLNAGGTLNILGTLNAAESVTARAGSISLASGKSLQVSGDLNAVAYNLAFAPDSQVSAAQIAMDIANDLTLGALKASGLADLQAGQNLQVNGAVQAQSFAFNAGGYALFADPLSIDGAMTGSSQGDMQFASNVTLGGNLELDAGGNLGIASLNTGGSADVEALGNVELGSLAVGTDANLKAGAGLNLGEINAAGIAQLAAGTVISASNITAQQLTYSAGRQAGFGTVSLAGNLTGNSGGSSFAGNVSLGGNLDLTSTGGISFAAGLSGQRLSMQASSDLEVSGALSASGNATLTSNGGAIVLGSSTNLSNGDLQLTAATGINLSDVVLDAGDLNLSAGGQATLAEGKTLALAGAIIANAGNLAFAETSLIEAASLSVTTSGNLILGQGDIVGAVSLLSGANLQTQDIAAQSLNMTAGGEVQAAHLHAAGTTQVNAGTSIRIVGVQSNSLDIGAGTSLELGQAVVAGAAQLISGTDMTLGSEGDLVISGATGVTAGGDLRLLSGISAQALAFTSGGQASFEGLSITQGLRGTAAGDLTFTDATSAGSISLAAGGTLDFQGELTSANAVTAKAASIQTAGITLGSGNLDLLASSGNIDLASNISVANGNVILVADAGSVSLVNGQSLNVTGDLNAKANSWVFAADTQISADQLVLNIASDLSVGTVNTSGLASLQAGGQVDLVGNLQALALDVSAGADVNTLSLSVSGDALLQAGRNLQVDGSIQAGNLDFSAAGFAGFAEPITLVDAMTGRTKGDMQFASSVVLGGNLNLNAGGKLSFAAALSGADMSLTGTQGLVFNNGLTSSGNVTLVSDELVALELAAAAGDADAQLKLASLSAAEALRIYVAGQLQLQSGGLHLGSDARVESQGDMTLDTGDIWMGADAKVISGGQLTISGAQLTAETSQLSAAKGMTIQTTGDALLGSLNTTAADALISLDSVAGIQISGAVDGFRLNYSAGSYAQFMEAINLTGALDGAALGDSLFAGAVAADSILVDAGGKAGFDASITALNGLSIRSELDMLLQGAVNAGNTELISSSGSLTFNSQLQTNGNLSLSAATDMAMNANALASGDAQIAAGSLIMDRATLLQAGRLAVSTLGDMQLNQLQALATDGTAISLNSGGAILARTDLNTASGKSHLQAAGGQTYLVAGTGMGDPLVVDLPWLSAITDSGSINLISRQSLYADALVVKDAGALRVGSLQGLEINQLQGGATEVFAATDLSVQQAQIASGGLRAANSVAVADLQLTSGEPLGIQSANIDVNLTGHTIDDTALLQAQLLLEGYYSGTRADTVAVDVANVDKLLIASLAAENATLTSSGSQLFAKRVDIGETLILESSDVNAKVDNLSARADQEFDVQLQTHQGQPFWLDLNEGLLTTSAVVTRRDPKVVEVDSQPGKAYEGSVAVNLPPVPGLPEFQAGGDTDPNAGGNDGGSTGGNNGGGNGGSNGGSSGNGQSLEPLTVLTIADSEMQKASRSVVIASPTPQAWYDQLQQMLGWMKPEDSNSAVSLEDLEFNLDTTIEISVDASTTEDVGVKTVAL